VKFVDIVRGQNEKFTGNLKIEEQQKKLLKKYWEF